MCRTDQRCCCDTASGCHWHCHGIAQHPTSQCHYDSASRCSTYCQLLAAYTLGEHPIDNEHHQLCVMLTDMQYTGTA